MSDLTDLGKQSFEELTHPSREEDLVAGVIATHPLNRPATRGFPTTDDSGSGAIVTSAYMF